MTPNEQVEMMKRCVYEFKLLREQVAHYKPKAEAYDVLAAVVGLLPQRHKGEGEDIVWMLEKAIGEILKMREESKPVEDAKAAV